MYRLFTFYCYISRAPGAVNIVFSCRRDIQERVPSCSKAIEMKKSVLGHALDRSSNKYSRDFKV